MKHVYPLITLFSAALVVAAPAPFVKPGPVVTPETEGVIIPNTNFERREEAFVADFSKRALKLRDALLVARGGQAKNNNAQAQNDDDDNDDNDDGLQQAQLDVLQGQQEAQGEGQGNDAAGEFLTLLFDTAPSDLTNSPRAAKGSFGSTSKSEWAGSCRTRKSRAEPKCS